jgi:hypothetical protein
MSTDRTTTCTGPADRSGWAPPRSRTGTTGGDGTAMTALRVTTYVLTSLASIVFLAMVVYGAVQLNRLQNAFQGVTGGFGAASPAAPFDASPGIPPDEGYVDPLEDADEGAAPPNSERDWSCTFAPDGTQVCEGDVPPSVGEYVTPEEYDAGN